MKGGKKVGSISGEGEKKKRGMNGCREGKGENISGCREGGEGWKKREREIPETS